MKRNKLTLKQRRRKGVISSKKHKKNSKNRPKRLLGFKRERESNLYGINKKQLEEISKILKEQSKEKEGGIENK